MDKYITIVPKSKGLFAERLNELSKEVENFLKSEAAEGRQLQYAKIFLSDIINQEPELRASKLYTAWLADTASTMIEQAPADASKITLLLKTTDRQASFFFDSLRLSADEAAGLDSYQQTTLIFEKYIRMIEGRGLDFATHLVRTWIYVSDIDVNYAGVVRARNDVFAQHGLMPDTHFIASTGIGGSTSVVGANVTIDFLSFPKATPDDIFFLKAPDHLNPTHEYGVAFERGTRVQNGDTQQFYISGTASIDSSGKVMHVGNVAKQTDRLLENIAALLANGGAKMDDIKYFIAYLRDAADYDVVNNIMNQRFPNTPRVLVHAKVCRPAWLVEMECIAQR